MPDPIDPILKQTPIVKVTWTANYKGTTTNFRLIMDDSPNGDEYTIETRSTDAVGKAAWSEFLQVSSTTDDRTATKMTPKTLSALFDAIYTA